MRWRRYRPPMTRVQKARLLCLMAACCIIALTIVFAFHLKTILEVLSLQSRVSKNADYLTEQVRQALSRSICKQNLADTGELLAVTLAPEVENTIAQGVGPDGSSMTLDPDFTRRMLDNLNSELERAISSSGNQPVLLCSSPIRLPFRRLIERTYPQIAVMSYNEISNNVKAKSIGVIRVSPARV